VVYFLVEEVDAGPEISRSPYIQPAVAEASGLTISATHQLQADIQLSKPGRGGTSGRTRTISQHAALAEDTAHALHAQQPQPQPQPQPLPLPRCSYDQTQVGCYRLNPRHLAEERHSNPNSASVKAQAGGVSGSASGDASDGTSSGGGSTSDGFIPGSVRGQWHLYGYVPAPSGNPLAVVPDIHVLTARGPRSRHVRVCPSSTKWMGTQPWLMASQKNASCSCADCGNTRTKSRFLAWHEQACWQWLMGQGLLEMHA